MSSKNLNDDSQSTKQSDERLLQLTNDMR